MRPTVTGPLYYKRIVLMENESLRGLIALPEGAVGAIPVFSDRNRAAEYAASEGGADLPMDFMKRDGAKEPNTE